MVFTNKNPNVSDYGDFLRNIGHIQDNTESILFI